MEKVKEYRINVRQFLTKPNPKYPNKAPVPMRTMFGQITKETEKAIYVVMKGKPEPTDTCMRCGRGLDHPVSVLYGIGPECGMHYHISPFSTKEELDAQMDILKANLADVVYEGWLPKGYITYEETGETVEKAETELEASNKDLAKKAEKKPEPAVLEPVKADKELAKKLASEFNKMFK